MALSLLVAFYQVVKLLYLALLFQWSKLQRWPMTLLAINTFVSSGGEIGSYSAGLASYSELGTKSRNVMRTDDWKVETKFAMAKCQDHKSSEPWRHVICNIIILWWLNFRAVYICFLNKNLD